MYIHMYVLFMYVCVYAVCLSNPACEFTHMHVCVRWPVLSRMRCIFVKYVNMREIFAKYEHISQVCSASTSM